jgi:hypothetical protein
VYDDDERSLGRQVQAVHSTFQSQRDQNALALLRLRAAGTTLWFCAQAGLPLLGVGQRLPWADLALFVLAASMVGLAVAARRAAWPLRVAWLSLALLGAGGGGAGERFDPRRGRRRVSLDSGRADGGAGQERGGGDLDPGAARWGRGVAPRLG